MDYNTFIDVLDFNYRTGNSPIIISGGEPFEHPCFTMFLGYMTGKDYLKNMPITVTTNGLYLSEHLDELDMYLKYNPNIIFQVTADDRYYPTKINEEEISKYPNVVIEHRITAIYPQGRAVQNNLSWERKSSHCFNVRAIAKQMKNPTFQEIIYMQNAKFHFCTPHIDINGNIKIGESSLCPVCSNIYKTDKEIVDDIINFKCHQCDFINNKLPEMYRKFVE